MGHSAFKGGTGLTSPNPLTGHGAEESKLTEEGVQRLKQIRQRRNEMNDKYLDILEQGADRLLQDAKDINEQIAIQNVALNEVRSRRMVELHDTMAWR